MFLRLLQGNLLVRDYCKRCRVIVEKKKMRTPRMASVLFLPVLVICQCMRAKTCFLHGNIVAKGIKISTDQFPPPKNEHQKSACFSPVFACFRLFSPVFVCFRLFFACFSQKLAPARKNSNDWSARSARFCNSV